MVERMEDGYQNNAKEEEVAYYVWFRDFAEEEIMTKQPRTHTAQMRIPINCSNRQQTPWDYQINVRSDRKPRVGVWNHFGRPDLSLTESWI